MTGRRSIAFRALASCAYRPITSRDCSAHAIRPDPRLRKDSRDERTLRVAEAGDVVNEQHRQSLLQVAVRRGDLTVPAQIVPNQHELIPARARPLHQVNMMRPGARHPLPEQHLAREPALVFGDVRVSESAERIDGDRSRLRETTDPGHGTTRTNGS